MVAQELRCSIPRLDPDGRRKWLLASLKPGVDRVDKAVINLPLIHHPREVRQPQVGGCSGSCAAGANVDHGLLSLGACCEVTQDVSVNRLNYVSPDARFFCQKDIAH
jgi:hypothetical protein